MKFKKLPKRGLAFGLAVVLTAALIVPTVLAAPAPEAQWKAATAPANGNGSSAIDQSYYNYKSGAASKKRAALPAKFNLMEQGKSTTVKDQTPWGTCWAFAAAAASESNTLIQQGAAGDKAAASPDYSERFLGWFAYQPQADGEGKKNLNNAVFNQGGNRGMMTALLSAWSGMESEAKAPYLADESADWSLPESQRANSLARLKNADFLPGTAVFSNAADHTGYTFDKNALSSIKQALMQNGAVSASYYADQSTPNQDSVDGAYIDNTNFAQYTYEYMAVNHSVAIVGWDDSYAKENFIDGHRPAEDGAWIVKNSWNSSWGNDGYFYLSYYDQSVCEFTSYSYELPVDGKFSYDNNYQYDFLGLAARSATLPSSGENSIANIFTAAGEETLRAVSAVTVDPGSTVSIKVYKVPDTSNPVNGSLVAEKTVTLPYGGYHTIVLDAPVSLSAGEKFSIVETIQGASGYYSPIELGDTNAYAGNDNGFTLVPDANKDTATISQGQSFRQSGNGQWQDLKTNPLNFGSGSSLTTGNVMIKAFTVNGSVSETAPELKSVTVNSIDSMDASIASTPFAVTSDTVSLEIPAHTSKIKLSLLLSGNASTEVTVGGKTYAPDEAIPRSVFENNSIKVKMTPKDGADPKTYTLLVPTVPDTVLSNNSVTLTDKNSYFPKESAFTASTVTTGADYDAVKTALEKNGSQDKFRLYSLSVQYNGSPFDLASGKMAKLSIGNLTGYDAAATSLYSVKLSNGTAALTLLADVKNSALTADIWNVNGYYVMAESQNVPPVPNLSPVTYDPKRTLNDISFGSVSDGVWSWVNGSTVPTVDKNAYQAKFTPGASSKYRSVTLDIPLKVNPADPKLSGLAVADDYIYGENLGAKQITGNAEVSSAGGDQKVIGAFSWQDAETKPPIAGGTYTVVFTPEDTVNYNTVTSVLRITVGKKPIVITPTAVSRPYGAENPAFDFTVPQDALAEGDTKESLGVTLKTTAGTTSAVGTYDISLENFTSENYLVTLENGTGKLTVAPRAVTITPDNMEITYGDALPTKFTFKAEGLVNGDTETAVTATLHTNAEEDSLAGDYVINGSAVAINYEVTVKPGTLTIKPFVLASPNVENKSALPNTTTDRIAVSGSFSVDEGGQIVVKDVDKTTAAYKAMTKAVSTDKQILDYMLDIMLEGIAKESGKLKVTLPVDEKYNGRDVTVLHYLLAGEMDQTGTKVEEDTVDVYEGLKAVDGKVSVDVYTLSPFAVVAAKDAPASSGGESSDPGSSSNTGSSGGSGTSSGGQNSSGGTQTGGTGSKAPSTGDTTNSWLPIAGIILAVVIIAALVIVRIRSKK